MPSDAREIVPSQPLGIASPLHCAFCFDVIETQIHNNQIESPSLKRQTTIQLSDPPSTAYPLFVTWNKRRNNAPVDSSDDSDWSLRGCIGTFAPQPLVAGLREYAAIAAFEDSRFTPIRANELSRLRCDVSLLHAFEECATWDDWSLQVHGIQISLTHKGRRYGGTYLPGVALSQNWDKIQTMQSLIEKAGLDLIADEAFRRSISVRRYQSSKTSCTHAEFEQIKAEAQKGKSQD